MTITINEDCTGVLINSDYFDPTNQSMTLAITQNCDAEYEVDVDVELGEYTVTPEDVDTTEFVPDGVYRFVLTTVQEDGTTVEESKCIFVNCTSACLMTEAFLNVGNDIDCTIKAMAYHALVAAADCPGCTCQDLCTLYNATGLNGTTDATSCGCS